MKENQIGDIVWAKISGYPWWPAKITQKIAEDLFRVDFYGDGSYANLQSNKIKPFTAFLKQLGCKPMKSKDLTKAISLALNQTQTNCSDLEAHSDTSPLSLYPQRFDIKTNSSPKLLSKAKEQDTKPKKESKDIPPLILTPVKLCQVQLDLHNTTSKSFESQIQRDQSQDSSLQGVQSRIVRKLYKIMRRCYAVGTVQALFLGTKVAESIEQKAESGSDKRRLVFKCCSVLSSGRIPLQTLFERHNLSILEFNTNLA